jgi:hypothetical protein
MTATSTNGRATSLCISLNNVRTLQDDARGVGYGALSGGNGDSDNDDAYCDDDNDDTHSFGSFNGCSDAPQEQDPDATIASDSPAWGFEELSEKQQPATISGKLCVIVHVAACNTAVVCDLCHIHCCC